MTEYEVRLGETRFPFHVCAGESSWPELQRHVRGLDADLFAVVTDVGVPRSAVRSAVSALGGVARTEVLTLTAEEKDKTLATVDRLAGQVIRAGATRASVVVALGGGLVGNVAGLLAALLYRGVRLVHLPTTLLAMSDSALSLKQAVNSGAGKNHLGTFHAPVLVWNNLDLLTSLPPEEISSALCETIKNVLGIVPGRYDELAVALRPDARYSLDTLAGFIDLCVHAKAEVTRHDPLEQREGLVLEYGHTVGHAAELLTGGALRHGHAVGVGMLVAARVSRLLGHLDTEVEAAHHALLVRNGAPVHLPADVNENALMDVIQYDNKRGYLPARPGTTDLVLLAGLGRPLVHGDSLLTRVDDQLLRQAIRSTTPATPKAVIS